MVPSNTTDIIQKTLLKLQKDSDPLVKAELGKETYLWTLAVAWKKSNQTGDAEFVEKHLRRMRKSMKGQAEGESAPVPAPPAALPPVSAPVSTHATGVNPTTVGEIGRDLAVAMDRMDIDTPVDKLPVGPNVRILCQYHSCGSTNPLSSADIADPCRPSGLNNTGSVGATGTGSPTCSHVFTPSTNTGGNPASAHRIYSRGGTIGRASAKTQSRRSRYIPQDSQACE